jgi:transcriptional regulator with XRE-family HTH domain
MARKKKKKREPIPLGSTLLRDWLKERQMNQKELACMVEKAGKDYGVDLSMSLMSVSHYVCGRRRPMGFRAMMLEQITGITADDWNELV